MLKVILLLVVLSVALLLFMGSVCLALKIASALVEQFGKRSRRGGAACSVSGEAAGRTIFRADMQAALRDALPRFSFDNAAAMSRDMALIATDRRGRILSFNRGAENLFGYRAADVNGRLSIDFLFCDNEASALVDLMQRTKGQKFTTFEALVADAIDSGPEERQWTWRKRNSEPVPITLTTTPLKNNNGVTEGFLFVGSRNNSFRNYSGNESSTESTPTHTVEKSFRE